MRWLLRSRYVRAVSGAGLMVKNILALTSVDPGLDPNNVDLDYQRRDTMRTVGYYREMLMQVRWSPGLRALHLAALSRWTTDTPYGPCEDRSVEREGRSLADQFRLRDYFRWYVPLSWRAFTDQDTETTLRVALINEPGRARRARIRSGSESNWARERGTGLG
jgi:hypothetical protein